MLSPVASTGLFVNIISVGVAGGWLCENVSTDDSSEEFFDAISECVADAQVELPPLVLDEMESGAALTRTATCFLANASVIHDEGLDLFGSFIADNLHAFRRGVGSLRVDGHASPDGSPLHNRCLSERRVEYVQRLVASMLGRDFNIEPGGIEGFGLGESISAEVSQPHDPFWRMVELAINRSGMKMMVEQAP